jgi:hypothetical protein
MDSNDISISSDKEKLKNISNLQIKPNQSIHTQSTNTNIIMDATKQSVAFNKNSSLQIYNFINEMPFDNLNDYYDIESSLFLKRIEKLNLKFYWTSESILNQQDIKYPYNKLFLILFKQISLYIEEIARLNKQLKQKTKNEKNFQIKISQLKQKEKENMLNKQMLKNLQRDNKLLEKKNEKNKEQIEKLNKKLDNLNKKTNGNNTSTSGIERINYNKDSNNNIAGSPRFSCTTLGYDSIFTQETLLSKHTNKMTEFNDENKCTINMKTKNKNKNKNKSVSTSVNKSFNNNNREIINSGIILCDQELEQLDIIEEILKSFKNKNIKNCNKDSHNNSGNINYRTNNSVTIGSSLNNGKNFKKNKVYNNKTSIPIKKKFNKM